MSIFITVPVGYWMELFCGLILEEHFHRYIHCLTSTSTTINDDGMSMSDFGNHDNTDSSNARTNCHHQVINNLHLVNKTFHHAFLVSSKQYKHHMFDSIYCNKGIPPSLPAGITQSMCLKFSTQAYDFIQGYSEAKYVCTYETFRHFYVHFIYCQFVAEMLHCLLYTDKKKVSNSCWTRLYTLNYALFIKKDTNLCCKWVYQLLREDIFPLCFKQAKLLLETQSWSELTFLHTNLSQAVSVEETKHQEKEHLRVVYGHFTKYVKMTCRYLDRFYIPDYNLATLDRQTESVFEIEYVRQLTVVSDV